MTKVEEAIKKCHELLEKEGLKFVVIADEPNSEDFGMSINCTRNEFLSWLYTICRNESIYRNIIISVANELQKEK